MNMEKYTKKCSVCGKEFLFSHCWENYHWKLKTKGHTKYQCSYLCCLEELRKKEKNIKYKKRGVI